MLIQFKVKYPSQKSDTITLNAGKNYYIEGRLREGSGNDFFYIGITNPSGILVRPMPNTNYSKISGVNLLPTISITKPNNNL